MTNFCENSVNVVTGLENYLSCSVTKKPCAFQRYCIAREEAINTEGYKDCKARIKKKDDTIFENDIVVSNESNLVENLQEELLEIKEIPKKKTKTFGIVTLVAKTYVVFDYNGTSCYKNGHFDVKIGDKIEV